MNNNNNAAATRHPTTNALANTHAAASPFSFKYSPFVVGEYRTDGTVIGEGAFGHVLLGERIAATGELVAIKVTKREWVQSASAALQRQLKREMEVLQKLQHENLVNLFSIEKHPKDNSMCFVMEYCDGGDLEGWINRAKALEQSQQQQHHPNNNSNQHGGGGSRRNPAEGLLTEENACVFISQVANALHNLKSTDILHRDLKPGNILLKYRKTNNANTNTPSASASTSTSTSIHSMSAHNFIVKLGDFGLSRELSDPLELAQTRCGTGAYMAPEVSRGQPYTFKSDLYSVGIILFKLLLGQLPPKQHPSKEELIHFLSTFPISAPCMDLLLRLLELDQANRIDSVHLLMHPWLKAASSYSTSISTASSSPTVITPPSSATVATTSLTHSSSLLQYMAPTSKAVRTTKGTPHSTTKLSGTALMSIVKSLSKLRAWVSHDSPNPPDNRLALALAHHTMAILMLNLRADDKVGDSSNIGAVDNDIASAFTTIFDQASQLLESVHPISTLSATSPSSSTSSSSTSTSTSSTRETPTTAASFHPMTTTQHLAKSSSPGPASHPPSSLCVSSELSIAQLIAAACIRVAKELANEEMFHVGQVRVRPPSFLVKCIDKYTVIDECLSYASSLVGCYQHQQQPRQTSQQPLSLELDATISQLKSFVVAHLTILDKARR
jgi:serine/threonine protein kinase